MEWQWHLPCRVVIMTIRGHCIGREQNLARCRHSINISCYCVLFQMNEVTWARITVLLGGRGRIRTHIRLPLEAESGLGHNVNLLDVFEVGFKDTRQISLKYSRSWKDGAFNATNGTAPSWPLQGHCQYRETILTNMGKYFMAMQIRIWRLSFWLLQCGNTTGTGQSRPVYQQACFIRTTPKDARTV